MATHPAHPVIHAPREHFRVDNGFKRAQNQGHKTRHGHPITGWYTSTATPGILRLVKTCCGERS